MGHPLFTQCHYLKVSKFSCNCYSLSKTKIKFYLWYIVVSQFIKLFIFIYVWHFVYLTHIWSVFDIAFFRINLSCGRQITLLFMRPPYNHSSGRQITLLFWRPPDNPSSGCQITLLFWRLQDNSSLLAAAR